MFNAEHPRCKTCLIAVAFVRCRIGEEELKRNCNRICGKAKRKDKGQSKQLELDLLSEASKKIEK